MEWQIYAAINLAQVMFKAKPHTDSSLDTPHTGIPNVNLYKHLRALASLQLRILGTRSLYVAQPTPTR